MWLWRLNQAKVEKQLLMMVWMLEYDYFCVYKYSIKVVLSASLFNELWIPLVACKSKLRLLLTKNNYGFNKIKNYSNKLIVVVSSFLSSFVWMLKIEVSGFMFSAFGNIESRIKNNYESLLSIYIYLYL